MGQLLGRSEASLASAYNYANTLIALERFEEAKALMRKTMPVAQRVLGESHQLTLRMRGVYAVALYKNCATLEDQREALATLEDVERTMRRVMGGAHPATAGIVEALRAVRATPSARETPPTSNNA